MGNCFGKPSSPDPFAQPGRTLGSAPPPPTSPPRAAIPSKVTTAGPGRSLGGPSNAPSSSDARSAAAKAAEERAAKAQVAPKGKLGKELAKERQQTRTNTLEAVSQRERQTRAADESTKNLQHN